MCRLLCSQLYWLSEAESLLHMYYPAVKGTRRTEEVGIHLVVQEHMKLIEHRVGIRAAVPRASNYLRVRIHLGELFDQVFGGH